MGKWKKLTAFAPALAAVIVAACAGISLNGYTAPVYAVEQPEALVTCLLYTSDAADEL